MPNTLDDLIKAYKYIIKNDLNFFIIGNGSNVLASDEEYNGIVIKLNKLNKITQIAKE